MNLSELKEYVELFSLKIMLTKDEKSILAISNVDDLFEGCDFTLLREKRRKKESDKQIADAKKRINEWCGCTVKYKKDKVYLRVKDEEIQTSRSASVPIREAHVLYDMIKSGRDVKGFQIGYYTVIGINGVLKIGCHEIERDEMERIATLLKWN
jgi:hypothetical protein